MNEKELIEEFLLDLRSIDSWYDDYLDNVADGEQLDQVIKKWTIWLDEEIRYSHRGEMGLQHDENWEMNP